MDVVDLYCAREPLVSLWRTERNQCVRDADPMNRDVGFENPVQPGHGPLMAGEENANLGYMTLGRLYATGYLKGLLEATA